ncbi:translation initiation factor IF-2-like isoform X2 [Nycticebus coucang]|uniref:translation initiation factor IF-2-like isoform X2 n=1 Tax=Nycticebus coucang TaxID=9470 RepID=UPI00234CC46C|nr:translation initiation factor IF-2-like isoform X2 [Nycticebus coucang]
MAPLLRGLRDRRARPASVAPDGAGARSAAVTAPGGSPGRPSAFPAACVARRGRAAASRSSRRRSSPVLRAWHTNFCPENPTSASGSDLPSRRNRALRAARAVAGAAPPRRDDPATVAPGSLRWGGWRLAAGKRPAAPALHVSGARAPRNAGRERERERESERERERARELVRPVRSRPAPPRPARPLCERHSQAGKGPRTEGGVAPAGSAVCSRLSAAGTRRPRRPGERSGPGCAPDSSSAGQGFPPHRVWVCARVRGLCLCVSGQMFVKNIPSHHPALQTGCSGPGWCVAGKEGHVRRRVRRHLRLSPVPRDVNFITWLRWCPPGSPKVLFSTSGSGICPARPACYPRAHPSSEDCAEPCGQGAADNEQRETPFCHWI